MVFFAMYKCLGKLYTNVCPSNYSSIETPTILLSVSDTTPIKTNITFNFIINSGMC